MSSFSEKWASEVGLCVNEQQEVSGSDPRDLLFSAFLTQLGSMKSLSKSLQVRSGSRTKLPVLNPALQFGPNASLSDLRRAAAKCKACDLWKAATQTVFGEGDATARYMFVGEQPGDAEDRQGRPFVGPAGRLLDEALTEAGIDRKDVYVTNVVKHFKWSAAERGKRRIHKNPKHSEIDSCRPWLDAELRAVKPKVLLCLGASAAQSLLGKTFRVSRQRGQVIESPLAPVVIATVHPSSILRAVNDESRQEQMAAFVHDLQIVAKLEKSTKKMI